MLQAIAKLFKVLNSESEPGQISMAFCFSMIAGFTPFWSLHNILVLLLVLIIRVNLSTFFLGLVFFTGVAYLLDPLFHRIGLAILTSDPLKGLWTVLYSSAIWRIERFNNSVLMGSLFISLVLLIPVYIFMNTMIRQYRVHILEWVRKSRVMKAFTASKLYRAYESVSGWRGSS